MCKLHLYGRHPVDNHNQCTYVPNDIVLYVFWMQRLFFLCCFYCTLFLTRYALSHVCRIELALEELFLSNPHISLALYAFACKRCRPCVCIVNTLRLCVDDWWILPTYYFPFLQPPCLRPPLGLLGRGLCFLGPRPSLLGMVCLLSVAQMDNLFILATGAHSTEPA